MAKRELIDESEVMMLVDDIFECQCDEKEAYELLDNVSTITEQEIIKPYLDKIRAEIADIQLIGYAIVDGKREIASRAVMQIIDKYNAESEG